MTVCIAALCDTSSSVVLVADRMITSGLAIQYEHPLSRKATPLSQNCLALVAGNALAFTELFHVVQHQTANRRFTGVEEFVEVLKQTYQDLRKKGIVERILRPRAFDSFEEFYHAQRIPEPLVFEIVSLMQQYDYGLSVLVGGVTYETAHIYAIEDPGYSQCYDSIGFHVIGSGTNLALSSLMGARCHSDMPRAEVLLKAAQAKWTAENAPGVGRRTDIFIVTPTGVAHIPQSGTKRLRELCKRWKRGDKTCLSEVEGLVSDALGQKKTGVAPNDGRVPSRWCA